MAEDIREHLSYLHLVIVVTLMFNTPLMLLE